MSNYHGCKGDAINLIPHCLIEIIQKTVRPPHFEKLWIIQNINKLMFQVIFMFSNWFLMTQILVSSTPLFLVLGENRFSKNCIWSFEWGTEKWVKMHRFNAFSNASTINWKIFPTHGGIHKSEKSTSILERDKTPRSLKK